MTKRLTLIMKNWTETYPVDTLVIFEDENLLALNKPSGVNVQDDQTGDKSLLSWIQELRGRKYHLLSRLDRPVSGIVLLSKKRGHELDLFTVHKKYRALVSLEIPEAQSLSHYIKRDGRKRKSYISDKPQPGYKPCQLEYRRIKSLDRYALLEITTQTGRFHQIRAQLAHINCPIRGDVKYGARRSNKDRSIDLHAYQVLIPETDLNIKAVPLGREQVWEQLIKDGVI